jgi:hypothetical protein
MKQLIAYIEAEKLEELIIGIDSIAATLERKENSRKASAPDKSSRYNFKVFDSEICSFDDLGREIEITGIQNQINDLSALNTNLVAENDMLKGKIQELTSQIKKTPVTTEIYDEELPKNVKEVKTTKPKRMTY